jgi:ornithine decarboxylase
MLIFTTSDYINDGVYGAFNCLLFDHQIVHPYVLFMKGSFHIAEDEEKNLCSVWGPTCDSIDCVSPKTVLPAGLQVGDWLGFNNMGAYTSCAASQFNGFEVSKVIYTGGADSDVRNILYAFAQDRL